ncbi:NAD(P)-dependent oxidoreductase [Acidisphaera sp. L21]|uniref:NAD-dependent epimerase/dehydratase family protein n=1 Tax=Acidisphaera sp. L21 TaxID=1641851 RepID=UPI00131B6845|nr:SDR family oxidoreductase [Acidisphaera sp. L21]
MTVLITGGTGFLGAWVARCLQAGGHAVRVLDRNADRSMLAAILGEAAVPDCIVADITDGEAVAAAAAGCDSIVHLAAMLTPACQADPPRGAAVNLGGTLAVFEAARRHGIRQVAYASSAAVYGPEGGTPRPDTHYGAFKLACELSARVYWLEHRVASVGLRPLVIYGPGREVGSTAGLSIACRKAASGEPYTIPFTGATDAIYVDDVAAAFAAAATRPPDGTHVLNLRGEVVDVAEVIAILTAMFPKAVLDAAGPPVPIAPELPRSDVEAVLGSLPRTTLREGLAQTTRFRGGSVSQESTA